MWPYLDADVYPGFVMLLELADQIDRDPAAASDRLPYDLYAIADQVRRLRAEAARAWQDWANPPKRRRSE